MVAEQQGGAYGLGRFTGDSYNQDLLNNIYDRSRNKSLLFLLVVALLFFWVDYIKIISRFNDLNSLEESVERLREGADGTSQERKD